MTNGDADDDDRGMSESMEPIDDVCANNSMVHEFVLFASLDVDVVIHRRHVMIMVQVIPPLRCP
eukprot:CAMPEP_0198122746 /NCGR_PEP_ID=MMETSP1442-20131203/35719_1 /TAXON_ID= /ORGANISM="Craspedostauros australis, Strain CCMP3328" /LENGTH=63 /DNA_ID=CAMNT_0043781827 /DNA_START=138 /DNA_END=329 /DNA_ORIENTATION=+